MISIPVKNDKVASGYEMRSFPMLDPHRLVHMLMTNIGLEIPESRVARFWRIHREELKEPWALASPASSKHIPFAIYGDGAKIRDDGTKIVGLFLSMPAIWRPRSSRCGRWCVFALEEHKLFGSATLDEVYRRLVWSCNVLFTGNDPDQPGKPLCNGRVFTCTEIKGDWQWLKMSMHFKSTWQSMQEVCFLCDTLARSNDQKKLYYCCDDDPHWTNYDVLGFLTHQIVDPTPCVLEVIDGFVPTLDFFKNWKYAGSYKFECSHHALA